MKTHMVIIHYDINDVDDDNDNDNIKKEKLVSNERSQIIKR